MGLLPPVVATLIADTKEYTAKMDEAGLKMKEFGATSETTGGKVKAFGATASTAVLGMGVALGAYAVDKAYKFQEGMDKISNQAGLTKKQTDALGTSILNISGATGQTTSDLQGAALLVEQSGIRGAKATNLLTTAAKAAVITNSSVVDTTQAIVSAQSLQIAKGMDVTTMTGKLVAGSKDFVGGLKAEEAMLSGRAGVSLANYGLKLSTVVAIGSQFAKVQMPTRSITSFTTGLANLEKPITDTTGKFTAFHNAVEKTGLSQNKLVSYLRTGNLGGLLAYIKEQAGGSAQKLTEMVNAVFGSTGGAGASVLIKNLKDFVTVQKTVAGAGAGSLASGFSNAVKQLGPQFKIVMAQVDVLFVKAGQALLPKVADALKWANGVMDYFKGHPIFAKVIVDDVHFVGKVVSTIASTISSDLNRVINFGGVLNPLHDLVGTIGDLFGTPAYAPKRNTGLPGALSSRSPFTPTAKKTLTVNNIAKVKKR